ncbi:MAG: nucleotidyltransferase family protein [Enterocloster sp.]
MKIVGIIAEYNPFHSGHSYHIRQARMKTGAQYCIAVMSGDFVQRGEPAVFSKYLRTRMALTCGADLVIELPSIFAVSSAEDFAACGVALLNSLGIVDYLCFGSEEGEIAPIRALASLLASESSDFSDRLKEGLRTGLSWPQARNKALLDLACCDPDFPAKSDALNRLLGSPNSLLGIEYCKALIRSRSSLIPVTVSRRGQGYHDETLEGGQASASAIRRLLTENSSLPHNDARLLSHIPPELLPLYCQEKALTADDFSLVLNSVLLTVFREERILTEYADVSEELANRLKNCLLQYDSWQGRIAQLKTKQYTYTRISRCLLHLLLGITHDQISRAKDIGYAPYARILGFKKEAAPLLSQLKHSSSIPLITKTAAADRLLTGTALDMFRQDLYASHMRQAAMLRHNGEYIKNEFNQPLCIL